MMKQEELVKEEEGILQGQAEIWKIMMSFAESMALKCAVELRIADIINAHGHPITLSEIATSINGSSSSQDVDCLSRVMRLLVRKRIFTLSQPTSEEEEAVYGLNNSSRWLLSDSSSSDEPGGLAATVLMQNHPLLMTPWHYLSKCVQEGGNGFTKAHGCRVWDMTAANPEFNRIFNDGMAGTTKIICKAVLSAYREGFAAMGTGSVVVDVAGGTGTAVAEIVKAHPHIQGILFDLPHVVDTAPQYQGVSNVGGDMFVSIPKADAIILQWILHNWSDADCIKILKNCLKAIAEKSGKIIIVEIVLQPYGEGLFDESRVVADLLMIANYSGRQRTEIELKKLLEEAGFPRYKIIQIPALPSIIEAYPEN